MEAIKNFSDDAVIQYINNFHDNSLSNSTGAFGQACTFNPLDKLMDMVEENRKLYERLLESEREKSALLEKMIK